MPSSGLNMIDKLMGCLPRQLDLAGTIHLIDRPRHLLLRLFQFRIAHYMPHILLVWCHEVDRGICPSQVLGNETPSLYLPDSWPSTLC